MNKFTTLIVSALALAGCAIAPFEKKTEADLSDFAGIDFGELSQGLNIFEGNLSGICFASPPPGSNRCPESDDHDSFLFTIPQGFESISVAVTTDNAGLGRHLNVDMPERRVPTNGSTHFLRRMEFGTTENIVATRNMILGSDPVLKGGETYSIDMFFTDSIPQGTHSVNWRVVINVQPPV